jgi:hypothetical protein
VGSKGVHSVAGASTVVVTAEGTIDKQEQALDGWLERTVLVS